MEVINKIIRTINWIYQAWVLIKIKPTTLILFVSFFGGAILLCLIPCESPNILENLKEMFLPFTFYTFFNAMLLIFIRDIETEHYYEDENQIKSYFIAHGMDIMSAGEICIFDLTGEQLKEINEYYKF